MKYLFIEGPGSTTLAICKMAGQGVKCALSNLHVWIDKA